MANLTNIELQVLRAALEKGDAGCADVGSRRVRTRTITRLQADRLLYSKNIDGAVEITERGVDALNGATVSA